MAATIQNALLKGANKNLYPLNLQMWITRHSVQFMGLKRVGLQTQAAWCSLLICLHKGLCSVTYFSLFQVKKIKQNSMTYIQTHKEDYKLSYNPFIEMQIFFFESVSHMFNTFKACKHPMSPYFTIRWQINEPWLGLYIINFNKNQWLDAYLCMYRTRFIVLLWWNIALYHTLIW